MIPMVLVLAYHSIEDLAFDYALSPRRFEQQMRWLKRLCRVVSLEELDAYLQNPEPVSRPLAVVTFDDGIRDNYLNAYPILKRLQLPGTIFMTTSLASVIHKNPTTGHPFPMLSWAEIEEMDREGLMRVEAHTHTHPLLPQISRDQIEEELDTCKKLLEEHLHRPMRFFAYPKGALDDKSKEEVRKRFSLAFVGGGALRDPRMVDRMAIPRLIVAASFPLWRFILMLCPWYWALRDWWTKIRSKF